MLVPGIGRDGRACLRLAGLRRQSSTYASVLQEIGNGVGGIHIDRGLVERRRRILVEIDIRVIERPANSSADGPLAIRSRRIGETEARRPVILGRLRRGERNHAGDVGDGTGLLCARTHGNRDVFVADAQIESQVRANAPVVIEVRPVLQVAEGNAVLGADAAFAARGRAECAAGRLVVHQKFFQTRVVVVAAGALHERSGQDGVDNAVARLEGMPAPRLGDVVLERRRVGDGAGGRVRIGSQLQSQIVELDVRKRVQARELEVSSPDAGVVAPVRYTQLIFEGGGEIVEFRHRSAVVDSRVGFEENRQSGVGIDADALVVDVAAAKLIPGADVRVDSHNGVVRIVEVRRGKRELAVGNIHAVHGYRIGGVGGAGHRDEFFENTQVGLVEAAHAIERGDARRRGSEYRLPRSRGLPQRVVLEAAEVKELVLPDGSADGSPEAIVVIARIGRLPRDNLGIILGVQLAVLHVFEEGAMELVGAGLHDYIEHAAGGAAILGAKLILSHVQLGDGLVRDIDLRTRDVAVVIVHAINVKTVVFRALSGDAGADPLANAARGSHTGSEQAQVVNARPVNHLGDAGRGHIDGGFGIESVLQLSSRRIDGGRRFGYFQRGAHGTYRQRQLN